MMDHLRLNYQPLLEIHVQLHPWQFQLLAKSSKKSIHIDMIVESTSQAFEKQFRQAVAKVLLNF